MKPLKTKEEKLEAMKRIIVSENIHQFLFGGNIGNSLEDKKLIDEFKKETKKNGK